MIEIAKTEIFGWKSAIRGMRNPMNSWDKSDSIFCDKRLCDGYRHQYCKTKQICEKFNTNIEIGENDLNLMQRLCKAGSDHAKFLRMINVAVDITAPLYWWKEFDTYKVGTVANSCSTMHKIHAKEFTLDDFSNEHLIRNNSCEDDLFNGNTALDCLGFIIDNLNYYRDMYLETKDKIYWWQMIQLLPSSYNQKRTVQLNYQVLLNMYHSRKNHKLDEWKTFCDWIESLPYFKEICLGGENNE